MVGKLFGLSVKKNLCRVERGACMTTPDDCMAGRWRRGVLFVLVPLVTIIQMQIPMKNRKFSTFLSIKIFL